MLILYLWWVILKPGIPPLYHIITLILSIINTGVKIYKRWIHITLNKLRNLSSITDKTGLILQRVNAVNECKSINWNEVHLFGNVPASLEQWFIFSDHLNPLTAESFQILWPVFLVGSVIPSPGCLSELMKIFSIICIFECQY